MRRAFLFLLALVPVALATAPAGAGDPEPPPNAVSSLQGPVHVEGGALPGAGQSFKPPERALPESVINVDDRERVFPTTAYPSSAIGHLEFTDHQGFGGGCTAFLVDANTALTSGHCVHAGGTGSQDDWFTEVQFSPGRNGVNWKPFGTCGVTEMWTTPGWYDETKEYQDLGVIQLDCNVGNEVGWLGYFARPGLKALNELATHLRGYPGDKPYGTQWTDKGKVWFSQALMVFYRNDTFGGQSGSPVFQWGKYCEGPCAMAIHGYGVHPHPNPPHRGNNHGTRISTERFTLIADIAGQNG